MMCTTVLHGGVRHHKSTPHKSGIKMTEKKLKKAYNNYSRNVTDVAYSRRTSAAQLWSAWDNELQWNLTIKVTNRTGQK